MGLVRAEIRHAGVNFPQAYDFLFRLSLQVTVPTLHGDDWIAKPLAHKDHNLACGLATNEIPELVYDFHQFGGCLIFVKPSHG
jgi:hypothetical protein